MQHLIFFPITNSDFWKLTKAINPVINCNKQKLFWTIVFLVRNISHVSFLLLPHILFILTHFLPAVLIRVHLHFNFFLVFFRNYSNFLFVFKKNKNSLVYRGWMHSRPKIPTHSAQCCRRLQFFVMYSRGLLFANQK